MFVTAHQSVEATSLRMYNTLKRRNYVTPTSYLETVANYRALLSEKRTELSSKANKLKGGLTKLDETRVQVRWEPTDGLCFVSGDRDRLPRGMMLQHSRVHRMHPPLTLPLYACLQVTEMKKVVQQKQVVVARAKHDCEELLVEIVQDKRVADEQEKQVCTGGLAAALQRGTKAGLTVPCRPAAALKGSLDLRDCVSTWLPVWHQGCLPFPAEVSYTGMSCPVCGGRGIALRVS